MDAMDDQPLHLQRDMTPSTHIEACMTMSVRRSSATRTALVTSALVRLTHGLEDPNLVWSDTGQAAKQGCRDILNMCGENRW